MEYFRIYLRCFSAEQSSYNMAVIVIILPGHYWPGQAGCDRGKGNTNVKSRNINQSRQADRQTGGGGDQGDKDNTTHRSPSPPPLPGSEITQTGTRNLNDCLCFYTIL